MNSFKILRWDSDFFGFKVARILSSKVKEGEFVKIIKDMNKNGVALAYWNTDPDDEESQKCARTMNAFLADKKTTFVKSLHAIQDIACSLTGSELIVEEYLDSVLTPELEELALQAGIFSRFRMDTRITEERFVELYKIWIKRSVNKEIADAVFVVRSEGRIAGMVTVGEKDNRSDIGLIAVDASLRGKSAGKALVQAALDWGYRQGYSQAQVVTQGDNLPACLFYEKCGYRVEKVENIYHIWLNL